jgi:hypothetical protein
MKEDISDIQKLIRLKRHEQPPADFVDNFMEEFVRRQRTEHLKRPWHASMTEVIGSFFESWNSSQWTLASAVAALALGLVLLWTPRGDVTPGSGSVQTVKLSNSEWKVAPQIYLDTTTGEKHELSDLSVHLLGNHYETGLIPNNGELTPKQLIEKVPDPAPLEVEPLVKFKD